MNLTEQERGTLIDTCKHIIERDNSSQHSENLRGIAEIALASLMARPAPAVNLADLVPKSLSYSAIPEEYPSYAEEIAHQRGFDHCRRIILRNIEEANGQTITASKVGSVADTEVQAGSEEASDEGESK